MLICIQIDELDRAVVEGEELGFVKVLTKKGTDKILGVTMVSTHAGDLLHEFVLARLFGVGLIATVVATVWLTRITRRELAKSKVNS